MDGDKGAKPYFSREFKGTMGLILLASVILIISDLVAMNLTLATKVATEVLSAAGITFQ